MFTESFTQSGVDSLKTNDKTQTFHFGPFITKFAMVHGFKSPFHICLRSFDKTDPLSIRRLQGKIYVIYMSKFLILDRLNSYLGSLDFTMLGNITLRIIHILAQWTLFRRHFEANGSCIFKDLQWKICNLKDHFKAGNMSLIRGLNMHLAQDDL